MIVLGSGSFFLSKKTTKSHLGKPFPFGKMAGNGWKRWKWLEMVSYVFICAMVKSRYIGDGHPTFNRNPYNGYINPYYWVDDHPLLYGNNGSLDPGTYVFLLVSKLIRYLPNRYLFLTQNSRIPFWIKPHPPKRSGKLSTFSRRIVKRDKTTSCSYWPCVHHASKLQKLAQNILKRLLRGSGYGR